MAEPSSLFCSVHISRGAYHSFLGAASVNPAEYGDWLPWLSGMRYFGNVITAEDIAGIRFDAAVPAGTVLDSYGGDDSETEVMIEYSNVTHNLKIGIGLFSENYNDFIRALALLRALAQYKDVHTEADDFILIAPIFWEPGCNAAVRLGKGCSSFVENPPAIWLEEAKKFFSPAYKSLDHDKAFNDFSHIGKNDTTRFFLDYSTNSYWAVSQNLAKLITHGGEFGTRGVVRSEEFLDANECSYYFNEIIRGLLDDCYMECPSGEFFQSKNESQKQEILSSIIESMLEDFVSPKYEKDSQVSAETAAAYDRIRSLAEKESLNAYPIYLDYKVTDLVCFLETAIKEQDHDFAQALLNQYIRFEGQLLQDVIACLAGTAYYKCQCEEWDLAIGLYDFALILSQISIKKDTRLNSLFCNALWVLQKDNTGRPVNGLMNEKFISACLPHAEENPAIYFNAMALYVEMNRYDKALEQLKKYVIFETSLLYQIPQAEMFADFAKTPEVKAIIKKHLV